MSYGFTFHNAGKNLQAQYERWQPRAKYKMHLDPTVDDVKKLAQSCRRTSKVRSLHLVPELTAELPVLSRCSDAMHPGPGRMRGCYSITTAMACHGQQRMGRFGFSTRATLSTSPCPFTTFRLGSGRPASASLTALRLGSSSTPSAPLRSNDSRYTPGAAARFVVVGCVRCALFDETKRQRLADCRRWRASPWWAAASTCRCLRAGATPCGSAS